MAMPGVNSLDGTGLKFDILANNDYILTSITVDTTTRDAGNTVTTNLRRGLLLAPDADADYRYIVADPADTSLVDDQAVVLAEDLYSIDTGNMLVKAFWRGTFKNDRIIDPNSALADAAYAIPAARLLVDKLQ